MPNVCSFERLSNYFITLLRFYTVNTILRFEFKSLNRIQSLKIIPNHSNIIIKIIIFYSKLIDPLYVNKRLKPEQGIKVVTKLFRYSIFMLQSSKSPYRQF